MRPLRTGPAVALCLAFLASAASTLWSLVGLAGPHVWSANVLEDGRAREERARSHSLLDALNGGRFRVPSLGLPEVQDLLDGETILLVYSLGEERSLLWAVTRTSLASFELPPRDQLEQEARRIHDALRESNRRLGRGFAKRAAQRASDLLLGQVARLLGDKRVAILAEGSLRSLPFAALPDPVHGTEPLVARHEIVILPSASVLAALRQLDATRPPRPGLVAVLADPVFNTADERLAAEGSPDQETVVSRSLSGSERSAFPRLPASRLEADAVLRLARGEKTLAAVGFDASRELATSGRLSQFRILHFAAHGFLDPAHPDRSGIVLSRYDRRGRGRDGILRAEEIRTLRLPADLVVLSACDTGAGADIAGAGRATLLRSFFEAGASRVVASLWAVDDRATAELMKRFYEGLLGEGLRPAAALRKAQISMMRETPWKAPAYWAGFFLEGDWR
jgi:CHAT domain-containing protein